MLSKLYVIQYYDGVFHKSNLGQLVYFTKKSDAVIYMKYNHYSGTIVELNVSINKG